MTILKNLIDGEMTLSDHRRLVSLDRMGDADAANVIPIHPDFRVIVLANRPGWPFLGAQIPFITGPLILTKVTTFFANAATCSACTPLTIPM